MTTTIMKDLHVVFAMILAAMTLSVAEAGVAEPPGRASCHRESPGGDCAATWDFSAAPRAFFFVEQFEIDSVKGGWNRFEGPVPGTLGVSDNPVPGGHLYRVVGCSDRAGTVDCVGSTVFWAPARPANLDDIPDIVYTPEGNWLRDRRFSRSAQILDYNLALMFQLASTVDKSSLPPMTELPFADLRTLPAGMSDEDATLDYNVHGMYPVH